MERDGLKVLLADINAGLIDMIVVYKIDRLTRSLSDFSKIVDRLDAHGASFVSVTQSFNTATSMGRLTLNMLLSFAQFEREVTAERIRDKIAASKAKGLWMGGTVPLGYDPNPDKNIRGLVMNEREAKDVKRIFVLYDKLGNLSCSREACERESIRSKSGGQRGGVVMGKGAIHHILTNPIYIGKIKHKDKIYDGLHQAIIDLDIWEKVQDLLIDKANKPRGIEVDRNYSAPLKGKLFDASGDHLTPTHTKKKSTRPAKEGERESSQNKDRTIRYYISNRLIKAKDPTGWRLPAKMLEKSVENMLRQHLERAKVDLALIKCEDIAELQLIHDSIEVHSFVGNQILGIVKAIKLSQNVMDIELDQKRLSGMLQVQPERINTDILKLSPNMTLRKRGVETKIVLGTFEQIPNINLLETLRKARQWLAEIKAGKSPAQIAREQKIEIDYFRKRIGFALFSSKIQKAIVTGKHPNDWSVAKFVKTPIPDDWPAQEKLFAC